MQYHDVVRVRSTVSLGIFALQCAESPVAG
jgi:hypothetical protein